MLDVKGLTVMGSDGIEKVKSVDLSVKKGEIVGIAGVAGSGQGELIEAVFGLRKPKTGTIIYKGQDITFATPKEKREEKIGHVPRTVWPRDAARTAAWWKTASWVIMWPTGSGTPFL